MGNKNVAVKIKEYRRHMGIEHILAVWEDGTSSWERLESVNCRGLMLDFVNDGISYLRKKEEMDNLENQKKKEAAMLQKLIDQNMSLQTKAPARLETPTFGSKPAPGLESMGVSKAPFRSVTADVQLGPTRDAIPENAQNKAIKGFTPVGSSKKTDKPNMFSLCDSTLKICSFLFYYKKEAPDMEVDISQVYYSPISKIAARIHGLYHQDNSNIGMYFAEVPQDSESHMLSYFRSAMMDNGLVAIHMSGKTCWVFDFSFKLLEMLGLAPRGDALVLRIENDYYLSRLMRFKSTVQEDVLWAENNYATPVHIMVSHLFSGEKLSSHLPGVFIGNSESATGKYATLLIKNGPGLAPNLANGCSAIIQDSYMGYLHQVPYYETLLSFKNKFFSIRNFNILEVLKPTGIFTISTRLMENCDIVEISEFLSKLADAEGWNLHVPSVVYNCFKQKAASISINCIDISIMKKAYNILKNGCIEAKELDYLSQLRKTFWKETRYFYLIDMEATTGKSISLVQAGKIIGA